MSKQLELVQFPKINHIRILVNEISFRNAHLHKEFELLMVIKGHGQFVINGAECKCEEGDVYLIGSHDIHSISAMPLEDGTLDLDNTPVLDRKSVV